MSPKSTNQVKLDQKRLIGLMATLITSSCVLRLSFSNTILNHDVLITSIVTENLPFSQWLKVILCVCEHNQNPYEEHHFVLWKCTHGAHPNYITHSSLGYPITAVRPFPTPGVLAAPLDVYSLLKDPPDQIWKYIFVDMHDTKTSESQAVGKHYHFKRMSPVMTWKPQNP